MKKRIIALLTAAFTLSASFTLPGAVFADETVNTTETSTVLFEDNFESGSLNGWIKSSGSVPTVIDYGGDYGKVAKYSGSQWDLFGYSLNEPVQSGKIKISYDFNPVSFKAGENGQTLRFSLLKLPLTSNARPDSGDGYWAFLRYSYLSDENEYLSPTKAVVNGAANNGWIEPSSTVGYKSTKGEWIRVNIVVDIDNGVVDYYFNGKHYCKNESTDIKNTLTQFRSFLFDGMGFDNSTCFYFDNFKIEHNDLAFEYEVETNEDSKTIDLKFNQTVSADTVLDNIILTKMGGETVEVAKTEKVNGDKIRITYNGNLELGREYKISTQCGIKSIYGSTVNDILFNAGSYAQDDKGFSTSFDDFESIDNVVKPYVPTISGTATKSLETISGTNKAVKLATEATDNGANVLFLINGDDGKYKWYYPNGITSFSTSLYIDNSNTDNMFFQYQNFEKGGRKTLLKFTAAGKVVAVDIDGNTLREIGEFKKGEWHDIKTDIDYDKQTITYTVDEYAPACFTFEQIKYNPSYTKESVANTTNAMRQLWFGGWVYTNYSFMIDNISLTHKSSQTAVKNVRFINASGDELTGDELAAGVKKIKVNFNKAITVSDIDKFKNNFSLKNGDATVEFDGALNDDNTSYTLSAQNDGSFDVGLDYKLTVNAVAGMQSNCEYKFSIGNIDVTSITGANTAYNASNGQKLSDVLPATLTANYDGGSVNADVVWTSDKYNRFTPGTYIAKATVTLPNGYKYDGDDITTSVTVAESTEEVKNLENAVVLKNVSERSPIAIGGLSATDSLQIGILANEMTVTMSDEFETKEYANGGNLGSTNIAIADSDGGEKINGYAKTMSDGEIEIKFNTPQTLKDLKLVFSNVSEYATADLEWGKQTDTFTGWDLELLYNDGQKWKKFYIDATDFKTYKDEGAEANVYGSAIEKHDTIFPTLKLSNLNELTGVTGIKIRLKAQDGKNYKLIETDVNVANESTAIQNKRAEVKTPVEFSTVYSNGAVIQRDKNFVVSGFGGTKNKNIKVELVKTSDGSVIETKTTKSDGDKWKVEFSEVAGSKDDYKLIAYEEENSANKAEISNILFGDVYLAAGQSNMAMALSNVVGKMATVTGKSRAEIETELGIGKGDGYVRYFSQQGYRSSIEPLGDAYSGKWFTDNNTFNWATLNNGTSSINASAVVHYFAEKIYSETQIPVAVYTVPRNGSDIRAWMTEESYNTVYSKELTDFDRSNYMDGMIRTGSYNALIAPLTEQKIKGVIWYQGEGNASAPDMYEKQFKALVQGWRDAFNDQTLNFNYVQLGGWDKGTNYPDFRNMQMKLWLTMDENIDMTTAIDLGMTGVSSADDDIHYVNKKPVGERLALNALKRFYQKDIENNGPLFKSVALSDGKIKISFDNADGLCGQDRDGLLAETFVSADVKGFEASEDGSVWELVSAVAYADGYVEITPDSGKDYKYVRYAWLSNAVGKTTDGDYVQKANLYNSANLPAYPFTTAIKTDAVISTAVAGNTTKVTVEFDSSTLKTAATLVVAFYNSDNTLKNVEVKPISFLLSETYTESFDMSGAASVKALLLDNMTNLKPLARQN